MKALHVLLMTVLLVLALAAPAHAQAGAFGGGATHIKARLVGESARPAPGSRVTLAFDMVPEPGWHGYWLNPGDAGKGMSVDWSVPYGSRPGALRYPVPQTLLVAGLMNHVYEGPYAVLTEFGVSADARPGDRLPIRASAQWLACTDSVCVPEAADLSLDLVVGDGAIAPEARARFDGWRAALPRPLGLDATYARTVAGIRLAIPLPASVTLDDPWFFRATEAGGSYADAQHFSRAGDQLLVDIAGFEGAPDRIEGLLKIAPGQGLWLVARPGAVPSGGESVEGKGTGLGLWWALGGALLGGLLLNIMPCVFPVLSLKALSLARAGGMSERDARAEALAYGAGVVATCLALGGALLALRAGGQAVGWAFQLQNPAVILLLALVAFAVTLNLAGVFHLNAVDAGDDLARRGGTHGAFWTGALVAFVATPCTGPFMATALGAALVLPVGEAMAIFAGLGIGLAAPFVALGFVPALRRALPRPGPWMVRLQRALAAPMALTVAALLWLIWRQAGATGLGIAMAMLALGGGVLWLVGRAQRTGRGVRTLLPSLALAGLVAGAAWALPAGTTAASRDTAFSTAALARAQADGKPVFAYFTADWCVTCKVNEAAAIDRAEVRAAFAQAGVVVLEGDWTRGDPAIGRFLESHGRSGVPLYLWYRRGEKKGEELPQILTPAMLIDRAEAVR